MANRSSNLRSADESVSAPTNSVGILQTIADSANGARGLAITTLASLVTGAALSACNCSNIIPTEISCAAAEADAFRLSADYAERMIGFGESYVEDCQSGPFMALQCGEELLTVTGKTTYAALEDALEMYYEEDYLPDRAAEEFMRSIDKDVAPNHPKLQSEWASVETSYELASTAATYFLSLIRSGKCESIALPNDVEEKLR